MRILIIILCLMMSGCATVYYPSPHADQGNQVKYKYSFKMLKCDYCKQDMYCYKIVNSKKMMCNKCFQKIRYKLP